MKKHGSARAAELGNELRDAAAALIAVIERVEPERWRRIPAPGVWSIGKDAEHAAEAAMYHQWIVRLSLGEKVPSRRPALDRERLTTRLAPKEAGHLLRRRTEEGATLVEELTDKQLGLPTRPPRARAQSLADTIERVMIGHYHAHREAIESKLALPSRPLK